MAEHRQSWLVVDGWECCLGVKEDKDRLLLLYGIELGVVVHLKDIEIHRSAIGETLLGCRYPPLQVVM